MAAPVSPTFHETDRLVASASAPTIQSRIRTVSASTRRSLPADSQQQRHSVAESEDSSSNENAAPSTINSRPDLISHNSSSSSNQLHAHSINPTRSRSSGTFDELTPEILGLTGSHNQIGQTYSRYSSVPSRNSAIGLSGYGTDSADYSGDENYVAPRSSFMPPGYIQTDSPPSQRNSMASFTQGEMARAATTDALLWDEKNEEMDDYLHNPGPGDYKGRRPPMGTVPVLNKHGGSYGTRRSEAEKFNVWSFRGILNVVGLVVILGGVLGIFAFWPIATYFSDLKNKAHLVGWNIGGINASGQVPEINGFPNMIDADTPKDLYTKKGLDGRDYVLVFSDEFNQDGRTFWPGDDPFWEGQDLNYWATHNYEWCDPDALSTANGKLQITMTEQPIHGLNFKSGFATTWNKFCFSGGARIEVSVSLPGTASAIGFWPGVWTMGNLGRAGFGATNDGLWPYSYDSCDVGTQKNQTNADGTTPAAALTSGDPDYGGTLSYLPGQRLSACTCRGDEHPGPSNNKGRAAPEIDILEAQVDWQGYGTASQSVQIAPFDNSWDWDNTSTGWTKHSDLTSLNLWKGSINQESLSAVTILDAVSYGGAQYQTFGYEYQQGRQDGYITWFVGNNATWTLNAAALRPNDVTEIGQRLISEEPMYILLNLFISSKFQGNPDFGHLTFPTTMYIDYVRVYQPRGQIDVGCSPSHHPTEKYIQDHLAAYDNPNATVWTEAGYQWPRNSRASGGCSVQRAGP